MYEGTSEIQRLVI
ncbi:hypothetical protein L2213_11270, partial [Xanthomonas perforans]|nr:hypothetical protein [Xanthomonas perforans]MCF6042764.1 hypothetical protein [Xanthomonas perforans]